MKPKFILFFIYLALWQMSYFFHFSRWYILVGTIPFLYLYYRQFFYDRKWYFAPFLFSMYLLFLLIPSFLTGTFHNSLLTSPLLKIIILPTTIYSILFSIEIIPIVYSTLVEWNRKKPVYGMLLTGLAYFVILTPLFRSYSLFAIAKLILYNLSFDLVFSLYISFLYLSENKKLAGPSVFFSLYTLFSFLNITEDVSPLLEIVWRVVSISILLIFTYFLMGENIWTRKLFKSKKRVRIKKPIKKSDVAVAFIMVLVVFIAVGGYLTHTISADPTPSMYPVITPGSLLFIEPEAPANIHIGEIIEFRAPWANNTLYAHEVVSIKNVGNQIYFKTRGINNPVDDPGLVPGSDVLGEVVLHVPYLGYVLIYGRVSAALVAVLGIASVLFESFHKKSKGFAF